ncbi:C45 family peptidase [Streptomyces mayonensis]|uniref:C45 family peptidase n=1 Tax=Streptomyces mayonensis TaxID=2750816 RepID=UPI0027E3B939|nr:C45 family peptidase [Streptomyces sp. A108]
MDRPGAAPGHAPGRRRWRPLVIHPAIDYVAHLVRFAWGSGNRAATAHDLPGHRGRRRRRRAVGRLRPAPVAGDGGPADRRGPDSAGRGLRPHAVRYPHAGTGPGTGPPGRRTRPAPGGNPPHPRGTAAVLPVLHPDRPERHAARNYDLRPDQCEGTIVSSCCLRPEIGMQDVLWGLLDGMNDAGLAVSLNWGGRSVHGRGFAILIVVRYLLETCDTVDEALDRLRSLPVAIPQNLTLVDPAKAATVFLGPDMPPTPAPDACAANHQHLPVTDE